MTNQYDELIDAFDKKWEKLISEYKSLKEQNAELKADLDRSREDLMRAHKEVLDLRKQCDHLRIAGGISGSEEERTASRRQINKLVREIDKCLSLLDE